MSKKGEITLPQVLVQPRVALRLGGRKVTLIRRTLKRQSVQRAAEGGVTCDGRSDCDTGGRREAKMLKMMFS